MKKINKKLLLSATHGGLLCGGGAFHSWDFEQKKQKICFKGMLF